MFTIVRSPAEDLVGWYIDCQDCGMFIECDSEQHAENLSLTYECECQKCVN